jgi:hypothetical protein
VQSNYNTSFSLATFLSNCLFGISLRYVSSSSFSTNSGIIHRTFALELMSVLAGFPFRKNLYSPCYESCSFGIASGGKIDFLEASNFNLLITDG